MDTGKTKIVECPKCNEEGESCLEETELTCPICCYEWTHAPGTALSPDMRTERHELARLCRELHDTAHKIAMYGRLDEERRYIAAALHLSEFAPLIHVLYEIEDLKRRAGIPYKRLGKPATIMMDRLAQRPARLQGISNETVPPKES